MENIIQIDSVQEYCAPMGIEVKNPLVTIVELFKSFPVITMKFRYGLYCIAFKEVDCGTLQYGRSKYDYQEGTMVFVAPGQVLSFNGTGEIVTPKGKILLFHPDLLYGTPLAKRMKDYHFFAYTSNEALHMSEDEKALIFRCFDDIKGELEKPVDKHSKQILASYIETLLNHCARFYERQFTTRGRANFDVLAKFENIVNEYYSSDMPSTVGLPSVQYCAQQVCLSPNYFGDLIKKETGKTAQEYIQRAVIEKAKELLADKELTVCEVAYRLGFNYPHHLNRMFKKYVGTTPGEYRHGI